MALLSCLLHTGQNKTALDQFPLVLRHSVRFWVLYKSPFFNINLWEKNKTLAVSIAEKINTDMLTLCSFRLNILFCVLTTLCL